MSGPRPEPIPEVVTLCGSTRFREAIEAEQRRLTLEGRIVLSVGMFGHEEDLDESSQVKVDLDALHRRKIDLSQRIHVMNVGGYVGSSTRGEIAYARARGVAVTYLEPGHPEPRARATAAPSKKSGGTGNLGGS